MTDITFFSSPIGLGHVTRDVAIAQHFEKYSTKFVTGVGAARLAKESGFVVSDVYVPPKFNVQNGSLENPLRWLWKYYQYFKECKRISEKIIDEDVPKLIVSDEDFASATIAQEKKIPIIIITDILETTFTKGVARIIEKKMKQIMQNIKITCNIIR